MLNWKILNARLSYRAPSLILMLVCVCYWVIFACVTACELVCVHVCYWIIFLFPSVCFLAVAEVGVLLVCPLLVAGEWVGMCV